MKRLPEVVKRRIVEHLACYLSHLEVSELINNEFDVTVSPRHVRAYDPMSFQYVAGDRWREYHRLARQHFEAEIGKIPIAHRAVRLRRLEDIYQREISRGATTNARAALEQAAKEVGNVFTNVSQHAGQIKAIQTISIPDQTPEERRNMLIDRLTSALDSQRGKS